MYTLHCKPRSLSLKNGEISHQKSESAFEFKEKLFKISIARQ